MRFTPRMHFDCYGEVIGRFLWKDVYANDSCCARTTRVFIAIFSGVAKVFLFPIMCVAGVVVMPIYAIYKAITNKNDAYCEKACYAPGMTILCCLIGAGLVATFLWSSVVANHLKLKHAVHIFLGAIAVSVLANVYFAAKDHA